MRYTLFLYNDEAAMQHAPPEAMQEVMAAFGAYTEALKAAGVLVAADWLKPSLAATTVTLRGGGRRVEDGPYANTKEQLGGYYVIDVADLDAAIAWAEKCPSAAHGVVELRPSMQG